MSESCRSRQVFRRPRSRPQSYSSFANRFYSGCSDLTRGVKSLCRRQNERSYNQEMKSSSLARNLKLSVLISILLGGWLPSIACAQEHDSPDGPKASPAALELPISDRAVPSWTVVVQPPPPSSSPHAFWDRTNVLLFSGIVVTRGLDYASTRNFEARGRKEILLPQDVVDNSAGFASLEAAATLTSVGISYWLHRTGHHKLERWMSIGHIGVTGFGDARNYALKSRHSR